MKEKAAAAIVKYRMWILILAVLTSLVCAATIRRTRINYDLNRYLSADTMTSRALAVMEEEFGSSEQMRIMFHDLPDDVLEGHISQLNTMPEILLASHDSAEGVREKDGKTWELVTLTLNECDGASLVRALRGMFPDAGDYYVGGSAASQLDLQRRVAEEMPLVMAISLAVVIIVLLLTSQAWFEPAVILLVLMQSILINLGTNFIFPDISFITFAVSAILQLALSIDYAVMLLHTYNDCSDICETSAESMILALQETFMRISSSAFTTIAGLLSLLFMSFTIGFDIGVVLSKGIIISMIGVFLLMPAYTLLFKKPLQATRHKPIRLNGEHLAALIYKARRPVSVILVMLAVCGLYLQRQNTYTFTDSGNVTKGDTARINDIFGAANPLVLLIPGGDADTDYDTQRKLAGELLQIEMENGEKAVQKVNGMVTTGAQALEYLTAEDVAELTGMNSILVRLFFATHGFDESVRADRLLEAAASSEPASGNEQLTELAEALDTARSAFKGKNYDRMVLEVNFTPSDAQLTDCIDKIMKCIRDLYDDNFYITGVPMSTYDIGNAFRTDLWKINLITFFAILLIVTISFRSLRIPLILVFVIESAIWITMAISRVQNQPIFFMSYLICVSIQMGATIDYGILLCDQFRLRCRQEQTADKALAGALSHALPTILTSGTILITAGYIIGKICSVYYISSIGALLARGALISVALIVTLLPALLSRGGVKGERPQNV